MLVSFLGGAPTQQALVLTAFGWLGMLLLGFQSDSIYRRWPALEGLAAVVAVAAIIACTLLLGMMPHSDAALVGGASLVAGALAVRALRRRLAERHHAAVATAQLAMVWDESSRERVEEHVA